MADERPGGTGAGQGTARVEALAWSPAAGEPMRRVAVLDVAPDGVPGDRYREGTGSWSWHRTSALTLVDADQVEGAAQELGVALDPVALRRNVVVRGGSLDAWVGRRFRIGHVVLEGERPCHPCTHLEEALGLPGLKVALAGRGGLRVRVVEGGRIEVGQRLIGDSLSTVVVDKSPPGTAT